jgi:phosphomannomutase
VAQIERSVFKSYDIRGTYPDQLDERFAYLLGRSLPEVLGVRRVVVGHDARLSSPALCAALVGGLRQAGVRTAGLGLCPTELVYYALGADLDLDLGMMITASHNPPEYNGFKVVKCGGEVVPGRDGLDAAVDAMERMAPDALVAPAEPDQALALLGEFVSFALELVGAPPAEDLGLVVDAGNGVGGLLWRLLGPRVGIEPVGINLEPDGRFPSHHPDPSKRENLDLLVKKVGDSGAALGLAYDGDADRVVAVLEDGHVVDGSEMTACIAERMLARRPSASFGVGQTTSRKALDHFRARGVEPVVVPVGYAKIRRLMRESPQMTFAGEDAGHYYYRDFFCCDSSLISTLHLLHAASAGRLARFVHSLPGPWVRPRREPSFRFDDRALALSVCRRVARRALERHPNPLEVTCERRGGIARHCAPADVAGSEGARVDYEDWWFCVRPSGTEPIARLALEARSEELLAGRTAELSALFEP